MITTNITKLKDRDLYSLALFALYKLIGTSEYSSLSELIYVLDKNNFLNLCRFFGGQTITIPTLDELELLIYALLLFTSIKVEHKSEEEAYQTIRDLGCSNCKNVRKYYNKLTEVLSTYEFTPGRDY